MGGNALKKWCSASAYGIIAGMTENEKPQDENLDVPILEQKYDPNLIDQLYDFPCPYVIKVILTYEDGFEELVREVFSHHTTEADQVTYDLRPSSGGKYASVTAKFIAQSRQQIEAIYSELKQSPRVKFLL